jgi:hypothetical protein
MQTKKRGDAAAAPILSLADIFVSLSVVKVCVPLHITERKKKEATGPSHVVSASP